MNEKIKNVYEKIKLFSKSDDFIGFKNQTKEYLKKTNIFQKEIQKLIFFNLRQILLNVYKCNLNIETNIFRAVENNNIKSVQFLIENNFFSFDEKNENGDSLLTYSIECQSKEVYQYLHSFYPDFKFPPILTKPKKIFLTD